ncbi:acyltransferase family protein [Bifidobacterium sp. ESL0790]|uniref:acyltransferase family protein n=1 Tax=Bifidobacterium sp. ESL0790 TaxID=2983233 RepID=UPI0023F959FF|nr:acyltransferase family protein [Bifidobacterium sp. ESL0790]WEV73101.1 acyltransferase family protein [Bifidobacterium sp. ESL0790]
MLLIVATHFFYNSNWSIRTNSTNLSTWSSALYDSLYMTGQISVTLFVLISAYFLANSTSSPVPRATRLWIQVFFYSSVIVIISLVMHAAIRSTPVKLGARNIIAIFLPISMDNYWFMSAFFFLLFLGPFLNMVANTLNARSTIVLLTVMVWITFMIDILDPELHYFSDIAYLYTIYMIGVNIRHYADKLPRMRLWLALVISAVCFAVCVAGTYVIKNSPTLRDQFLYPTNILVAGFGACPILAVIAGSSIFLWLAQRPAPMHTGIFGKTVLLLASATFGVYLIHENDIVKHHLWPFVFSHPEPVSLLGKIVFSVVAIVVLYVVLLVVSLIINLCVLKPLIHLFDKLVISRIHFRTLDDLMVNLPLKEQETSKV